MNKNDVYPERLKKNHSPAIFILSLLVIALSVGCSSSKQAGDPYEKFNRKMFAFNKALDKAILKPVAKTYKDVTPQFLQTGVSNFLDNITYPTVIVNQFLQGNVELGLEDTGRLVLNSTVGIGGILDLATPTGLPKNNEDFGQTFAVWGFNSGPYLVAPFFGPMNPRDGLGKIADSFTNPINYIEDDIARYSLIGLSIVDARAELLDKEDMVSGDEYLFIRDAYLQKRTHLINNGKTEAEDPFLLLE